MIIIKMPVLSKLIFISNVIPIKILTGFIWFAWNINLFNLPEFIMLKNNWAKTSLFFLQNINEGELFLLLIKAYDRITTIIDWEFGIDIYTLIFKIGNQQVPTVQHREL